MRFDLAKIAKMYTATNTRGQGTWNSMAPEVKRETNTVQNVTYIVLDI